MSSDPRLKVESMPNFSAAGGVGSAMPRVRRWVGPAVHAVSDAIPLLIRLSIGMAFVYGASIAYGLAAGYALPTATIFFLLPRPELVARLETFLPRAVLLVAIIGASLWWLARWGLVDSSLLQRNEISSTRLLRRWGLLLVCAAFLFALSDGGWSGRIAGNFGNYASLAGLIPHSDATGHFLSPIEQVLTGSWSSFGSRRPFAAGFRQLTMVSVGFSYVGTLLLQAVLISAALFAAARSIVLWRGLWSGLAFFAFIYILVRPFLTTVLTEPLGLIWALLSIVFLVEAMRLQETRYAYLALVTLTLAEVTRMGSLFTIPAFVLWVALAFASTLRGRLKLLATGSILVALVLLIQKLCASLYGDPTATTGGNFAYTLCGLALGKDWTACPQIFAQEFSRFATERGQAEFLFSKGAEIISDNPQIMMSKLYDNAYTFITGIPSFMLFGYQGGSRVLQEWALVALIPGLYFTILRKRAQGELIFWISIFASMVISASIIFADDGWRVMYATWPLVALFLSLGVASPGAVTFPARRFRPPLSWRAGTLLIAVIVALVVVTPGLTRLWPGAQLARLSILDASANNEQAILAGRTLTGFIVIPDDAVRPKTVAALHAADFARLIRDIGIERDFGEFLEATMEHVPFAFVTAAQSNDPKNQSEQLYVAPVEILTGRPATAWRVMIDNRMQNKFIHVVTAIQRLP